MSDNYPPGVTNADFNEPKLIECPDCEGAGMTAHLYPGGHTEISCKLCDGSGKIESEDED